MGNSLLKQRLLIGLVLLLVVAASIWLRQRETVTVPAVKGEAHTTDYEMKGFRLSSYDSEGQLHYQIISDQLAHYPDSQITQISRSELLFYQQGQPQWQLQAERGELSGDGSRASLLGTVSMVSTARPMTLTTRDIRLDLATRRGATTAPVHVEYGDEMRVDATGLAVDLVRETLELKSKVRIVYENRY